MKRFSAVVFTAALVLAAACLQAQSMSTDAAAQAVRANEAQWNRDFTARDVNKLVAHNSDDATLMSPGMPPCHGRDAIRSALKQMVGDSSLSLKFHASRVMVASSGDVAWSEGTYTMNMTNPATKAPMTDKGTYVTVYRKASDGSWKAVSDIASSSSMPAPAPR